MSSRQWLVVSKQWNKGSFAAMYEEVLVHG